MKHRLEITVNNKSDKRKHRKASPRPLIEKGGSPDVLSRRKTGGITVYDLGWLLNGTSLLHQKLNADRTTIATPQIQDAYDGLDADILGGDSPFTRFKKLEKNNVVANTVRVRFTQDSIDYEDYPANLSQWMGTTLNIKQDAAASLRLVLDTGHPLYRNFDPTDGKVTNLPSFGAASVTFLPSKSMQIGLMPTIALQNMEVSPLPTGDDLILNNFISIIPRALIPNDFPHDWTAATFAQWTAICKSTVNARAFENSLGLPLIPLADFPGSSYSVVKGFVNGGNSPAGSLTAIVRSNGLLFYFWQT